MRRRGDAVTLFPCDSLLESFETSKVRIEDKRATLRGRFELSVMESLILAQNERWRHGLGMQVEREVRFGGWKVAQG